MLLTFKELRGVTIRATDGEIGKIHDLLFDDLWWITRYLMIDTGKWLPGRKVLISPRTAGRLENDRRMLPVELTKQMIERSPAVELDRPLSRDREAELIQYYGWPLYWGGPGIAPAGALGVNPGLVATVEAARVEAETSADPALRSASEVVDYHLQARDGDIGHVDDFLLDDTSWAIRYLIVSTRNWLPGRKVLVAPAWVERVSWGESTVYVDLTRDQVKGSPPYDPQAGIDRGYETRLYEHYGRPRYWT
jgi:hypothetical protein